MTASGVMHWTCPKCSMQWDLPKGDRPPRHECITSMVGLRVTWSCGRCLAHALTFEMAFAGAVTPTLPQAWTVADGRTLCGACSDEYVAKAA
jgi:hypothetical protein